MARCHRSSAIGGVKMQGSEMTSAITRAHRVRTLDDNHFFTRGKTGAIGERLGSRLSEGEVALIMLVENLGSRGLLSKVFGGKTVGSGRSFEHEDAQSEAPTLTPRCRR